MFLWGVNFAFVKYLLDTLGVGPFLFIRFVTMPLLAFLLLLLVFRKHVARTWPKRADLPRFIACGLIGHALHVGMVFWGISLSTAFSSALVLTSGPLIVLAYTLLFGAPPMILITAPSMFTADLGRLAAVVWLGLFWAIVLSSVGGWLVWAWVNHVRGIARSASSSPG